MSDNTINKKSAPRPHPERNLFVIGLLVVLAGAAFVLVSTRHKLPEYAQVRYQLTPTNPDRATDDCSELLQAWIQVVTLRIQRETDLSDEDWYVLQRGECGLVFGLAATTEDEFGPFLPLLERIPEAGFHGIHPNNEPFWSGVAELMPDTVDTTLTFEGGHITAQSLDEILDFKDQIEDLNGELGSAIPTDAMIVFEDSSERHPVSGQVVEHEYRLVVVNENAELSAEVIESCTLHSDERTNRPFVSLQFTEPGATQFCDLTTEYVGNTLAVVVDGKLVTAPSIEEPICAGRARINLGSVGSYDSMFREGEAMTSAIRLAMHSQDYTLELVGYAFPD